MGYLGGRYGLRIASGAVAVVVGLGLSGCSSKTRSSVASDVRNAGTEVAGVASSVGSNAAEAAARNVATRQGGQQFNDAGQELSGPLVCEAKVQRGVANVDITCNGMTKAGGVATLIGTTNEIPGASVVALRGTFTGTVDGQQVFSTKRLGG